MTSPPVWYIIRWKMPRGHQFRYEIYGQYVEDNRYELIEKHLIFEDAIDRRNQLNIEDRKDRGQ